MEQITEDDFKDMMNKITSNPKAEQIQWVAHTGAGGVEYMAERNPAEFILMVDFGQITPNNEDSAKHLEELYNKTKEKLKWNK